MDRTNKDTKRWIAVGIAAAIFIMSIISGSISGMVNRNRQESESRMPDMASFLNSSSYMETVLQGTNTGERILVLNVQGVISSDQASSFNPVGYNHASLLSQLDGLKDDDTIKGVILRVDSPGGTTFASAELEEKIREVKEETSIPFYTSMGTIAASGGYYVSAPTDRIYASNETTTGSIGVIYQNYNYAGLFEKLGLQDESVKSAENKAMGSGTAPMTEEQLAIYRSLVDNAYNRFVNVVATGRNMPEETVRQIGDGRIYDGAQALEIGLVDKIGYFDTVVEDMATDLELDDPQVFEATYNPVPNLRNIFRISAQSLFNSDQTKQLEMLIDSYSKPFTPVLMYVYGGF